MDKKYEFRELLEIYSFCNELSNNQDNQHVETVSTEDQIWLTEAFKSQFVDPVKRMEESISFIKDNLVLRTSDDMLNNCIVIIHELQELTENFDFAQDFVKMGGLDLIRDLLLDRNVRLRSELFTLIGTINQNNLFCQNESINRNIIERLVDQMPHESDMFALKKIIYALSCTVRGNQGAFERFIQTNGLDLILNVFETSSSSAVRCKIAFFIYCVVAQMDTSKMGDRQAESCLNTFNNSLVNLESFRELETEHLLGSVYFLMKNYPSINLIRKYELFILLKTQLKHYTDLWSVEKITFYTNEILAMLCNRCLTITY